MNSFRRTCCTITAIGFLLAAAPSRAAQPPDPTPSDANGNTAGGTGALQNLTTGSGNSAFGYNTLFSTDSGSSNAGFGFRALLSNTSGTQNTGVGYDALASSFVEGGANGADNTAVGYTALLDGGSTFVNTAVGAYALRLNTSGAFNTAIGVGALQNNTDGSFNTATGLGALNANTDGIRNTADGINALLFATQNAIDNTAVGANALLNTNGAGSSNTATGSGALFSNTGGYENTATGYQALYSNTGAAFNAALGSSALFTANRGSSTGIGADALFNASDIINLAVGYRAGYSLGGGHSDIYIASDAGSASESRTIRIGAPGTQNATYIAGIFGSAATNPVCVDGDGHLGQCSTSSARYKSDIRDMGDASSNLMKLRPVTFRYKNDKKGVVQYGLIAEEVEKVYPELVGYGPDGKPESVRYHVLPAMLLNELQKQVRKGRSQTDQLTNLAREAKFIQTKSADQDARVARAEHRLDAQDAQIGALEARNYKVAALVRLLNTVEREARRIGPARIATR